MYPLKFKPIYTEKIWAGNKLRKVKPSLAEDQIGISWELSAHPNADNVISNGVYKGIKFSDIIQKEGRKLIGTKLECNQILRIAYLDASQDLSIQVHPYEKYAREYEKDGEKNESWYILEAEEGAYVVAGTTTTDKELLKQAVKNGTLENYIIKVPVKKGDFVIIKAGLLHALGKGILAIEVGQNGDTTYRLYDYNRGRKLDIEKSFDVLNTNLRCKKPVYLSANFSDYTKHYCFFDKEYALELIDINKEYKNISDPERYFVYTCVEGNCKIEYDLGIEEVFLGETVFIPACLGSYIFKGNCRLIRSYIPDVDKLESEILSYVKYK
ncbi:type I phosphomannose isomerase catalytic subunit [Maledivibacter halophilus]|uniref:Phosphohexomutase n=1 Tax=Maledivibacter halophilus TaxID=36842 RepID=A0A1T5IDX4_9FIRM|nr:type I phosphomannose isomerase catalytic subunit [Maledivibacter halophilus]SKC37295.1 mannose-6-phosphate isomerase, type 1 [Maledivibacter halophilus]